MRTYGQKLLQTFIVLTAMTLYVSCQADNESSPRPTDTTITFPQTADSVTYVMRLVGGCISFDGKTTRAGTTWNDGDAIHLEFTTGTTTTTGTARYTLEDDQWVITLANDIAEYEEGVCRAFFLENATEDDQQVTIGEQTVVYADQQGSYLIDEETNELIVYAVLAPLTARLRLVGEAGQRYGLQGLTRFTAFRPSTLALSSSSAKMTGTLNAEGSAGPIYVLFEDATQRRLIVDAYAADGSLLGNACFARTFAPTVLAAATNGYITIPTLQKEGTWKLANRDTGQEITLPSVSGVTVVRSSDKSATVSASAINLGNGTILDAGFVYATTQNPTMNQQHVSAGTAASFTARIRGLEPLTQYFVRAYVTNERGTAYGSQQSFTTTEEVQGTTFDRTGFGAEETWD